MDDNVRARIDRYTSHDVSGCWNWTGHIDRCGYGKCFPTHGTTLAHRASYLEYVGPIPGDYTIDHLCRNRACCNPDHLEAVPHRVNLFRSDLTIAVRNAGKTHCPAGHELVGANLVTQVTPNGTLGRKCRTCRNAQQRARRSRKHETV